MKQPAEDAITEGYRTADGFERWVCPTCFDDFREEFGFTITDKVP